MAGSPSPAHPAEIPAHRKRRQAPTSPFLLRFRTRWKLVRGLATLVKYELRNNPFTGTVFVFRAKKADCLKRLYWGGTGLVMPRFSSSDGAATPTRSGRTARWDIARPHQKPSSQWTRPTMH